MKILITLALLFVATTTLEDDSLWIQFKTKYTRKYNVLEEKLRFQIFQNNLRRIEEHNIKYEKGESSHYLKVTKFADWTEEEIATIFKTGPIKKIYEQPIEIFESKKSLNDLPESIDWREKNAVTEVRDSQRVHCTASYAFSAAGSLEGQYAISNGNLITLSPQDLIDCSDYNEGCEAGYVSWSFIYVQAGGISSEEQYPYVAATGECKVVANKPIVNITGFVELITNEQVLLEAVATVGPISVGVQANADWLFYGGGILDEGECTYLDFPNMDLLAVGYATAEKDYWILKNAWGADWAEDGYIRLVRGKNQSCIHIKNSYPIL